MPSAALFDVRLSCLLAEETERAAEATVRKHGGSFAHSSASRRTLPANGPRAADSLFSSLVSFAVSIASNDLTISGMRDRPLNADRVILMPSNSRKDAATDLILPSLVPSASRDWPIDFRPEATLEVLRPFAALLMLSRLEARDFRLSALPLSPLAALHTVLMDSAALLTPPNPPLVLFFNPTRAELIFSIALTASSVFAAKSITTSPSATASPR